MKTTLETIKKQIYENPGVSRRDITEKTGLDIRTVTAGIRKLLKQGFITASPDNKKSVGRTGMLYFPMDESKLCFAGVYLEIQEIICVFKDLHGKIMEIYREPFPLDWASLNHTAKRIDKIISRFVQEKKLQVNAIGLTIRERRGAQFGDGLSDLLELYSGLPVYCGTPIDAFAWSVKAQHPDAEKIVIIHFGITSIELCFIDGLSKSDESSKFARELSHATMDPNGPPCYCGKRGCLEYYVHGYAMEEEYRERKNVNPYEKINLAEYFLANEPVAVTIVNKAEKYIAAALKKTIEKFNPDLVAMLVLEFDTVVRNMKNIINGNWIPTAKKTDFEFHVYDIIGQGSTACAVASAEKAVLLSGTKNSESNNQLHEFHK